MPLTVIGSYGPTLNGLFEHALTQNELEIIPCIARVNCLGMSSVSTSEFWMKYLQRLHTFLPMTTGYDTLKSLSGMTRMGPFILKKDENCKEIVPSKYPLYFIDKPSAIEIVRPRESRGRYNMVATY